VTDLQAQLDAITANTRKLVQPERLAVSERFIQELLHSGIEREALAVGAAAPEFVLKDASGRVVRSADLLALGPVIVKFFRGRWDPYCTTELEAWRELYPAVRERGGLFVAVSPQLPRQNDFMVQHHGLPFPVLSDPGCELAGRFGIAYTLPEYMQRYYRSILVNIPFVNGEQSWRLPLPATFVLRQDGGVRFADAPADFRTRTDPGRVLSALA
jgi:peroxiredoxin